MTDDEPTNEAAVSEALDLALRSRAAGHPDIHQLNEDEQRLFDQLAPWLPALTLVYADEVAPADSSPVRANDPVALMLGLLPEAGAQLNGRKLAEARRAAGLDLGQLVQRINSRGWDVSIPTAALWERGAATPPPALLSTIAKELEVAPTFLLVSSVKPTSLDEVFDDSRIEALLEGWAAETGHSADQLRDRSLRLLAAAGRRNSTDASVEVVLALLQHFKSLPEFQRP